MRWPTTRQKCRTQTRGSLFFFRIARMQPFTGEDRSLWKRWPPRRRRKAKAYRGGIRVQRYLFPPSCVAPSLIREGTHETSSFFIPSPRSTAPSFLHVNPLARIQCMYIRTYIYIFQSRVSKPSWPRNTETSYSNLWNYSRMNFRGEKIQFNGLRRQLMDS